MLLTKANRKALPPLYTNEGNANPTVVVKFFNPCGRSTWYVTEFDGDDLFFGYVVGEFSPTEDEWGNFSLAELSSLRVRFGLPIEHDRHFRPQPIGDIVPDAVPPVDDATPQAIQDRP